MLKSSRFEGKLFILGLFIILTRLGQPANSLIDLDNPDQEAKCFSCIRNVTTPLNINGSRRCEGYFCGPYQISYTHWAEAGKPGNKDGIREFEKCARDTNCSEQTLRAYFRKFRRDCNNDGQIDCLDMAALHKGGPTSCSSDWFYKSRFWVAFNKTSCLSRIDHESGGSRLEFNNLPPSMRKPIRVLKNQTMTPECLDCICEATTGCNVNSNNCLGGTVCGPFAISLAYWKDGRKPGASWTTCTRTKECSSVTIKNYMEKYKRDCNDDGFLTCEDYAAIHRFGPRLCSSKELLKENYWNKFLACRANQAPQNDINMVKLNQPPDDITSSTKADVSLSSPSFISLAPTSIVDLNGITKPASLSSPKTEASNDARPSTQSHVRHNSKYDFTPSPPFIDHSSYDTMRPDTLLISFQAGQSKPTTADERLDSKQTPKRVSPSMMDDHSVSDTRREQPVASISNISNDYDKLIVASGSRIPYLSPPWTSPPQMIVTTKQATIQSPTTRSTDRPPSTLQPFSSSKSHLENKSGGTNNEASSISMRLDHVGSSQPVDRPTSTRTTQGTDDIAEFLSSGAALDRNNFDKVVIKIVESPAFPNLPPPIPNVSASSKELDSAADSTLPSQGTFNTNPQKSSYPFSRNPSPSQQSIEQPSRLSNVMHQRSTTNQQEASDKTTTNGNNNNNNLESLPNSILALDQIALNETSKISSECLDCICEASSNCDTSVQCISKQREKNRCGLYMISWNQFQESDILLTVIGNQQHSKDGTFDEKLYYDCSTDKNCAERLINLYVEKHQKDCNNDGRIDCYDIAAIHRAGPENCGSSKLLDSQYWKDFNLCYATERSSTMAAQTTSQLYLR